MELDVLNINTIFVYININISDKTKQNTKLKADIWSTSLV